VEVTDTDEPQVTVLIVDVGLAALTVDTDEPQPPTASMAGSTFSALVADDCTLVVETDDTEEPHPPALLMVGSTFSALVVDATCVRGTDALPTQTISGLSCTSVGGAPQLELNLRPPAAECQPSPVDQPGSESSVSKLSTTVVDPTIPFFPPLPPPFTPTLETLEELVDDDETPSFPLLPPDEEISSVA